MQISSRDRPHVFVQLDGDLCTCFRWRDDPIHNPNFGVATESDTPAPTSPQGKEKEPVHV